RPLINFMAIFEGGVIFLKAINFENEYKDKFYVTTLIKDAISEVTTKNVAQVITNNAPIYKDAASLVTYDVFCCINNVGDDAIFIRNIIMYHSMKLAIFHSFVPLKLLAAANTQFTSMIMMLKRLKLIKGVSKIWLLVMN
ncbi:hypothetical protein J1N35_034051, partial [Gossypium stocksii]